MMQTHFYLFSTVDEISDFFKKQFKGSSIQIKLKKADIFFQEQFSKDFEFIIERIANVNNDYLYLSNTISCYQKLYFKLGRHATVLLINFTKMQPENIEKSELNKNKSDDGIEIDLFFKLSRKVKLFNEQLENLLNDIYSRITLSESKKVNKPQKKFERLSPLKLSLPFDVIAPTISALIDCGKLSDNFGRNVNLEQSGPALSSFLNLYNKDGIVYMDSTITKYLSKECYKNSSEDFITIYNTVVCMLGRKTLKI